MFQDKSKRLFQLLSMKEMRENAEMEELKREQPTPEKKKKTSNVVREIASELMSFFTNDGERVKDKEIEEEWVAQEMISLFFSSHLFPRTAKCAAR